MDHDTEYRPVSGSGSPWLKNKKNMIDTCPETLL